MSLLFNSVCESPEDFEDYKNNFNAVKFNYPVKFEHSGEKDHWVWPALIVTVVNCEGKDIHCHHTSVSRRALLSLLGLSQEELKLEFNSKTATMNLTPETFEPREV
jgi:hypothetical protein